MSSKLKKRWLLTAAVAGVASLGALAPSAQAAYPNFPAPNDDKCSGASITGRGASFQNAAQLTWINQPTKGFQAKYCPLFGNPGEPTVAYEGLGSGAGRTACGASGGVRNPAIRYCAYDEAPTPAQKATMQAGLAGPADDALLHDVPVAQGPIAITVNFPAGCSLPLDEDLGAWQPEDDGTTRFLRDNNTIERVWAGQLTTWGDIAPGIIGAGCTTKPIKRVVRNDSSGTTFQFKQWLESIDDGVDDVDWGALGNTAWPVDAGGTAVARGGGDNTLDPPGCAGVDCTVNQQTVEPDCATDPTVPATGVAGNGAQADCLVDTDGGIAYTILADARIRGFTKTQGASGSFDDTFWIPVINGSGSPAEPTKDKKGAFSGKKGANCSKTVYQNVPLRADGKTPNSLGDWSTTIGVNSAKGYPICALTWMGVWDDYADAYGNNPTVQAEARSVFDYTTFVTGAGASLVTLHDYDKIPGKLKKAAQQPVKTGGMDWNKP